VARILIATFGSYGDLHPYLAIGRELRNRGHSVTLATSMIYREKVEAEGLAFHAVRPEIDPDDRRFFEALFDRRRGSEHVIRWVAGVVRETFADTLPAARDADLIVTHLITFAAVAVAEHLKKPWVSTVLAPASFISAYDPPLIPSALWVTKLRVFGPAFMKRIWDVGRRKSRAWVKPVLELRRELGLDTRESPLFEGANSPTRILALFSRALAEPAIDWPEQTIVTGFCFHEHAQSEWAGREPLEAFLAAGERPVVFTLGSSAVSVARDFYIESGAAIASLKARAIFLTGPMPQHLPDPLPPNILCLEYAPHAAIMPHASVIVHQGGVGTTAEAMRSGRPMLVVPFSHDQFDNAARVKRAGIGETLPRERYRASRVAALLSKLLMNPSYAAAGTKIAERIRSEHGARLAADEIELALKEPVLS
jgi:MGT family glycosyltransferase